MNTGAKETAATKFAHITGNLYTLVRINCNDWRFNKIYGNCVGLDPDTEHAVWDI